MSWSVQKRKKKLNWIISVGFKICNIFNPKLRVSTTGHSKKRFLFSVSIRFLFEIRYYLETLDSTAALSSLFFFYFFCSQRREKNPILSKLYPSKTSCCRGQNYVMRMLSKKKLDIFCTACQIILGTWVDNTVYTANVNRQTTDKLLFSHAIITDENM